jgi:hypothetical protein
MLRWRPIFFQRLGAGRVVLLAFAHLLRANAQPLAGEDHGRGAGADLLDGVELFAVSWLALLWSLCR